MHAILTIDKVHTAPQVAVDCGPGLNGLNEVKRGLWAQLSHYPFVASVLSFTRCIIRNQFDILLRAVADSNKGETDMTYQGENQTLTEQSIRYLYTTC